MAGPTGRLLGLPAPRRLLLVCGVLATVTAALVVLQWALVAAFVAAVFDGSGSPDELVPLVVGALGAGLARAALTAVRDLLAGRTSARLRADVRRELAAKLVRLGPHVMTGYRAG